MFPYQTKQNHADWCDKKNSTKKTEFILLKSHWLFPSCFVIIRFQNLRVDFIISEKKKKIRKQTLSFFFSIIKGSKDKQSL